MNLASVLDDTDAGSLALVHHSSRLTYGELRESVTAVAAQLASHGVGPGSQVVIACANTPVFVAAFLASAHLGAVAVPLNPASPTPELERELRAIDAAIAVVGPMCAASFAQVRGAPSTVLVPDGVEFDGAVVLASSPASTTTPPRYEAASDDVVALMFTSGTAGTPRPAKLTHGNVMANLDQMRRHPGGLSDVPQVVLGVLPFSHIYGLTMILAFTFSGGGSIVLMERFDASAALSLIRSESVTVVAGAPTMWAAFATIPEFDANAFDGVRHAVSGAAPLPAATHEAIRQRFGVDIREGYGLTEASPAVASSVGTDAPTGSVGRPLPGVEVRLIDQAGDDVLVGDEGEVWVRGPNVFPGYEDDDGSDASPVDEEGWLHTGDVAIVDDRGHLRLVDRVKDLIIVSGFNVYPAEVERALRDHPLIADAGVFGASDPVTGETVHAVVAPDRGATLEVEQVIEHCAGQLARYKCPTDVEFVDEVPRSATGKVLRRALRR